MCGYSYWNIEFGALGVVVAFILYLPLLYQFAEHEFIANGEICNLVRCTCA